MSDDLDNLSLSSAADLTVKTIEKIEATTEQLPSPALVTYTMGPEVLFVERRVVVNSVTDEAIGSMCIHAEQEWDEKMMGVPKCFERLLSYPVMGCGVHQKHT